MEILRLHRYLRHIHIGGDDDQERLVKLRRHKRVGSVACANLIAGFGPSYEHDTSIATRYMALGVRLIRLTYISPDPVGAIDEFHQAESPGGWA